jgi:hypothetical protein
MPEKPLMKKLFQDCLFAFVKFLPNLIAQA